MIQAAFEAGQRKSPLLDAEESSQVWNKARREGWEEIGLLKSQIVHLEQALERIAGMSDEVYSKGAYCSKIAREALGRMT